ncbi:hypothetical protein AB7M43_005775 [Bradyrhizobium elkanii]
MAAVFLILVATFDDEGNVGHVTYAVAVADATEAIRIAMDESARSAAVVSSELSETQLRDLHLNAGEVLALYDNKSDPITSGALRH